MRSPLRTALLGAFIAALATLPGLGAGTLWDNSETAYGEVAREILLTHDWVVMHLNGAPWFVQPPLYFWIAAAFAKIIGLTPFALRLPPALATIAMGALVGYATAALAGPRAGLFSAIVLSTNFMQVIVARLAIMDALLDLAVTLGILAIFRAFTGGRQALGILSAAAAIGFGLLAKGPVAALIVLMVIVPWLLWEWRAKGRLAWPAWGWWVAGILLTLVIVAPWIMAVTAREGPRALDELVGHYSVGRYLGTIENQSGPVWYYIPVLILGFFPWIAFLPPAIVAAWRTATSAPTESMPAHLARLSLVWALLPFLFFSFANTKLPNYIALEFPALALLVGLWFDRVAQGELRRAALIAATAVPLTIGAVAFAAGVFARDAHLVASARSVVPDAEMMAALLFIFSVATWVALLRRPTAGFAPYVLAVGAIAMLGYTATVAEPHAERFKPVPQLAAVIRAERQGGDAVAIQGVAGGNALLFYTAPHVYALDMPYETSRDGDNDPRHVICSARRTFVVTSRHRPSPDPTYGRERKLLARADNDVLYLYVDTGAPCATRVSALTF